MTALSSLAYEGFLRHVAACDDLDDWQAELRSELPVALCRAPGTAMIAPVP